MVSFYGVDDSEKGNYWVLDQNYGKLHQTVYIMNEAILSINMLKRLQKLLDNRLKDWEITIAISLEKKGFTHPDMGLVVHRHRIECFIPEIYWYLFPKARSFLS